MVAIANSSWCNYPKAVTKKVKPSKRVIKPLPTLAKNDSAEQGRKIKTENALTAPDLDIGFRVLKVDTSNMNDVYYTPDALNQKEFISVYRQHQARPHRRRFLLFQVLLDWGVELTLAD
jgi:adenine-specific DNA-methyltransferase